MKHYIHVMFTEKQPGHVLQFDNKLWGNAFNNRTFSTANTISCEFLKLQSSSFSNFGDKLLIVVRLILQEMVDFLVDVWHEEGLFD